MYATVKKRYTHSLTNRYHAKGPPKLTNHTPRQQSPNIGHRKGPPQKKKGRTKNRKKKEGKTRNRKQTEAKKEEAKTRSEHHQVEIPSRPQARLRLFFR